MKETFEELVALCRKERIGKWHRNQASYDVKAKKEYAMFRCWCRAYFEKPRFTETMFKRYMKAEKKYQDRELDFWLKKRIYELYFGYEFEFDYITKQWKSRKVVNK